ncbi:MAG: matrixin family metalloprotease [Propylenella sp.]
MHFRTLALAGALLALLGQAAAGGDARSLYRPLILDGHQLKWGEPNLGSEASVSYAVVAREMTFPGARNCSGIGPVGVLLSENRIADSEFQAELAQAFRAWETVAGITFVRADAESANILIGAQIEPRGRAFTNVSYDKTAKSQEIRSITRALICLNPAKPWKTGFDGDLEVYDLRYTLMHEIGHAIGLNHPQVRTVLMHFSYREKFRTPQAGDVEGAIALYGPSVAPSTVANASAAPDKAADAEGWGEVAFSERRLPIRDVDPK